MTDGGQISEVLQLIVDINEQNGKLSDVVLFIPAKAQLDSTIIDDTMQTCTFIGMQSGATVPDDRHEAISGRGLARLRWLLSDHESNSVELLIIL